MSHPHQVYGAGVGGGGGSYQQQQQQPSQQSQVHHALSSAVVGQQQQQQQFVGAQMSNVFTPQQYEVWQQYYSQIGGVQQQQQSVAALPQQQQQPQAHPFLSHSVQSMAQPSVPASSLAMLQQQQQSQMLVQQQQHQHHQQQLQHYGGIVGAGTSSMGAAAVMPPASPMVVSPSSAGLAAASLVQQQYLQQAALLAQQHHQQQQQQQYLLQQQQQQRQIAVVQPQQQQQLLQTGAATGAPAAGTAAVSFMAPLQNVHQSVGLPQHHHQPQQQQQQQLIQSHVPQNNTQIQLATATLQPSQPQKQHEKWDPVKEFGLQKDEMALKSPPSNTVAENTRLLKRREEEAAAGRQAYEASESQRVQEELQQQRASAKDAAHALQQRVNSFPEPIHLAGCHTLSKVSKFLPLPVELSSTATALPCFDLQQANQVLANTDESLADYLSTLLSDTTDELRKIELKHGEEESGDLDGIAPVPPMAQTIQAMNSFAFSVDPLDDEQEAMAQAFQNDIQEAVERMNSDAGMAAMAVAMFEAQQQGNHDELFMGTSGSSQQAQHQQQHNRSAIASGADGVCGHNIQQQSSEQEEEMRRRRQQIVSIGKPGIGGRRKKDMVESLYDSLTGYFDPGSKEKRKRGRKRYNSDGEELEEDMDAAGSPTASNDRCSEEPTDSATEGGGIDVSATRDPKSRKRARIEDDDKTEAKTAKLATNRPTTPTEVIQQRELEWNERQRQREEKYKRRRQQQNNSATDGGAPAMDAWTVDIVAEQESFCKFTALVDQVLEQMDEALGGTALSSNMHGDEAAAGLLLDRALLDELRVEAQKLKSWQKLCDVSTDRLVKLLTILEKNIRDVLTENGALSVLVGVKANEEDEMDETLKELIDERVLRSVDASLVALCIMTSKKMPKQLLMEDIIERSVQLSKQCLHDIIYPARDPTLKSMHAGSKSLSSSARKSAFAIEQLNTSIGGRKTAAKNTMVNQLYTRMVDLFTCFSELASAHNLNETLLVQLNSLGCPPFFVDNVPELQMQSIKLLPTIFAKCPAQRKALLFDLINSLHRLPPSRSMRNTYRLSATEHISNFTVLILQLIQSTVQLPTRKHHHHHHHGGGGAGAGRRSRRSSTEGGDDLTDRLVLDSYEEAKRMAAYFLGGFLGKCTARSEDDYRRIFEQFLQDILVALYRPLWPVTELILTVLGNLLVMHFRSKNYDLSLRVASMDYLGVIAARLRKDRVHALSVDASAKEKQRLNAIVRCILFDEHQQHSYDPTATSSSSTVGGRSVDDIDISHLSSSEKVRKLEQALFDYIIWTTWEGDVSMEYVLLFYAVEWYRETVLDVEIVKERYQKAMAQGNAISQKERQKFEQKLTRILEKGASMKTFITALMDKQHLKRRIQVLAKTGNVMVDSDALWVVKYLASKKELSQSFDLYLKKILEGFNPDLYPVAIRAKAMKCLAQIVEADYQVLMISEVNKIVQDRLIDANASVREATFDLIGKCLVSRPELLDTYYSILINRTKDTAVAVRKRVIRILRDIVFSRQDYAHRAQILVELLQRVNDEEGVRKLCLESFQQLWFQPVNMRTEEQKLREKLILMVETAKCCVTDGSIEYFETMICAIAKQQRVGTGQDSAAIFQASKQIVDALVDYVLELEKMVAQEQKKIVAGVTSEEETASTSTTATTTTATVAAAAVPLSSSQGQMAPPEDAQEVVNRTKHFQSHLFASLTLLSHFARARPEMLIRHIEVFVPYLTIAESSGLEFRVLNQIITMLEQIIPLMDAYSVAPMLIRQLDTRLNEIGRDGGMLLIASSISCMSALYEKFQPQEQPGICRLFMVYFKYLDKLKRELDQAQQQQQQQRADANTAGGAPYELSADKKPMLLRALYSTGLMCRHFDFDALLNDTQRAQLALTCGVHTTSNGTASSSNSNDVATPAVNSNNVVRTAVFSLLFHHSRSADHAISQKALIALGQLSAGHPELLRRDELKSMYMVLLNSDKRHYLQLKVQVLKNIACFLHVEEQKALRRADQAKREREQRARQQREAEEDLLAAAIEAQEDLSAAPGGINVLTPGAGVDDLKEMELSSSGLSSSIIQQYWTAILNCYFHNDEVVRVNAAQVIRQTLEQGLVTPGSSVPTLVAMSTDTLVNVRTRVEVLIRDMNTKYKGMILSKAIPGVRLSFQLQHKIRYDLSQAIRGIRSSENPLNSSVGPSAATTTAAASSSSSTDKKALSTLPTYANDAQALLGNFYVCIRVNRQQRRSFLTSLLKLFSEDHKEKIDREEWVYVADNLAHFPYTVLDEPLYVIHQANSIISVSGQSILSRFRQLLLRSTSRGDGTREQQQLQHQLQHVHLQQQQQQQQSPQRPTTRKRYLDLSGRSSNASSMGSSGSSGALLPPEELEEFSVEYIIEHLPSDRTHILELKLNSQACFLLLHLKLFLLRMYGLKEDKIAEYTPSEAAPVYEKACSRRNIRCFAPDFVINELAAAAASTGEQQRNADDWAERRRIAEDFHKFHEMLLSLDERRDDDEDEAAVGVVAVVPPFPCAATVTATVGDQQHQQLQQ